MRKNSRLLLTLGAASIVLSAGAAEVRAVTFTGPVKENLLAAIGQEVNKATKGNRCLLASEECQPGLASGEPGGFEFAKGVAVNGDKASPQDGHVYVIDNNHRVQELAADGSFVSMFGWDVNKTKVEKGGATQQEMNICTQTEIEAGGECQSGVEGSAAGQFGEVQTSIAIDPANGAVYVADRVKEHPGGTTTNGVRVQEFTADGRWVLEIGREVNETKDGTPGATAEEKNLCTQAEIEAEGVKCTGPSEYEFGGEPPANRTEPGTFPIEGATVVAVGGVEDLLYAGSGQRIQEFHASGTRRGQIPLASAVGQMAIDDSCRLQEPVLTEVTTPTCAAFDPSYGDLYVVDSGGTVIHKLGPNGEALTEFALSARAENTEHLFLDALAVDPAGRLAVSESEQLNGGEVLSFGSLLDSSTGHPITAFQMLRGEALRSLGFSASEEMYGTVRNEVASYDAIPVAELQTRSASCASGAESETDATFDCMLNGEVNPEGVPETEAWFQWGLAPVLLAEETPPQTICAATCGNAPLSMAPAPTTGVPPNQTVYYRLVGHDRNVQAPELLTSDTASFDTPMVAPRIVGAPSAPAVKSSSAVLSGELNPENAPTEYFFEYGTQLAGYCQGALRTRSLESAVYGKIGVTLEASGLQPGTTYQYRICASNQTGAAVDEHGGSNIQAGAFTTLAAPVPQATTGAASSITATSAVVSGTVNPDGQPATYSFELGIYTGASTQYGTVFSGSAGSSTAPVEKTLTLTGLRPGTVYAYRIKVKSGYGMAEGATLTFATAGLPAVLARSAPIAMLALPAISFPPNPGKAKPRKLTRAQRLAGALKKCEKKPKSKRAACKRRAHKKYAVGKHKARKSGDRR